ncbi:ser/Thr protein phosphatase family protein [Brachyspira sp. CAG:484]|nr:ser/Thr protein phosphatase family protein [Brachyspira sp. CAG:484]
MKIQKNNSYNQNFTGITKIYAIADSHQETRKTSAFLSKILSDSAKDKNVLFLNCGDIFKGIYPRNLERDCYLKLKNAKPDVEMVMTLGNNDFGFNKESLDYLVETVKNYTAKGIHTVCANIFEAGGKRPGWLKPYTIINRGGDKNLVTGFCIDNINTARFGLIPKKQQDVLNEINEAILKEKPDNVIILNHDYMPSSREIVNTCKKNGINVDLLIGGHDHDFVPPDKELNIYYPKSFSDSMYRMNIENNNGMKKLSGVEMIENNDLPLNPVFKNDLETYERATGLYNKIVPYTLDLKKQYSRPCPLGSFLADKMMETANADAAFFSTGFLMKPMDYRPDTYITNYLFKKTIIADTPVKTVELSAEELKAVFDNALKTHGYGSSNPRFLQCSNNIRIEGKNNPEAGIFEVKQIFINDEPLLDASSNPLKSTKKYKCVIDSFIADGGQGFKALQQAEKSDVILNGAAVPINKILLDGLKDAYKKYQPGAQYPSFILKTD